MLPPVAPPSLPVVPQRQLPGHDTSRRLSALTMKVFLPLLPLLLQGLLSATAADLGPQLVQQARPAAGGFALQLKGRHGVVRRRGLLRTGTMPIMGAVREVGYFYTELFLGTPARNFSVIIDTGSTITYIPCKGCAHCGKHTDEPFDPDKSTTAKKLGCSDTLCNCGSPTCQCRDERCYYSRSYAERSSSEGWLIEDNFGFPDRKEPVRLVFGCENGETGEIYKQLADGIMGMGNNDNAMQSQLVANGVIEDIFSLCFGYPDGGVLMLGDVALPDSSTTVHTPLLTNLHLHYYNVKMESITVDGTVLPIEPSLFDRGYGTVLDSGTTFSYLPAAAFKAFSTAVGKAAEAKGLKPSPGSDPNYIDICWQGAPHDIHDLGSVFPSAVFTFGGGTVLHLTPMRYLFMMGTGSYCLGVFDNGVSGTLIGGVSVRDVIVKYDRKNNRVGFTELSCGDYWASLPPPGAAAPAASPPPPQATQATKPSGKGQDTKQPSSKKAAPTPPKTSTPAPAASGAPGKLPTEPGSQHGSIQQQPGASTQEIGGTSATQSVLGGYQALVWTFLALVLVAIVAEIAIFHRPLVSKTVSYVRMRLAGARDSTELVPLASRAAAAGGGSTRV